MQNDSCFVERQLDEENSDVHLINLYNEAIAEYRQVARISKREEQLLVNNTTLQEYHQKVLEEWNAFHIPRCSGSQMKDGIRRVLHTLLEKIDLMDIVIAFPTQAVISGFLGVIND
jgi:hypothetical protein